MTDYRIYSSSGTEQCKRCLKVVGSNIQLIKDGICAECHMELWDRQKEMKPAHLFK